MRQTGHYTLLHTQAAWLWRRTWCEDAACQLLYASAQQHRRPLSRRRLQKLPLVVGTWNTTTMHEALLYTRSTSVCLNMDTTTKIAQFREQTGHYTLLYTYSTSVCLNIDTTTKIARTSTSNFATCKLQKLPLVVCSWKTSTIHEANWT